MTDKGKTYRSVWRSLMQVPFKQDYVTVDGLRTRYVEAGSTSSPPLVLLHGTGGHWEAFCDNIGFFAEHFHVFAFDFLGCGFTEKPDKPYEIRDYVAQTVAFMDAMGLKSASVIGVSLGAWVAARLAHDMPDRVDRMILISPPGLLPPRPAASSGTVSARQNSARDPSWENISNVLANLYYDRSSLIDDIVAVRQQVYSLPGIEQIMPRMLTLFEPETRIRNNLTEAEWREIKTPTLVIKHVDAPDLYLETAEALEGLLPDVKSQVMHHVAHWAQFEDAPRFNALALTFLKGTER